MVHGRFKRSVVFVANLETHFQVAYFFYPVMRTWGVVHVLCACYACSMRKLSSVEPSNQYYMQFDRSIANRGAFWCINLIVFSMGMC